jgi:hypothetical protein
MKALNVMAGLASLVLAYLALKDRGLLGATEQAPTSTVPDTDPDPNAYWFDHNRWRVM